MKIILSNQCESLTGTLSKGTGYFVQARRSKSGKVSFFGVRSRGNVPSDGRWRFIEACARLAKSGLHIADVMVNWQEVYDALYEAHHFVAADKIGWNGREGKKTTYNAQDILNLKTTFGL